MRYHKRLMLLTIACLLPSVLARLPVDFIDNRLILWLIDAVVLVCVWDSIAGGNADCTRPSVGGAAVVLGVLHAAFYVTQTQGWLSLGTWMVS